MPDAPPDYIQLARRRLVQYRSDHPLPPDPLRQRRAPRPYRPRLDRTATYAAIIPSPSSTPIDLPAADITKSTPAFSSPNVEFVGAVEPSTRPSFLQDEFARLREQQDRPRRRRYWPQTRVGKVALTAPLVLLVVAGIIMAPVIYRATRAYQDVFVEPVPRESVPIAVRNAEGTVEIVLATETPSDADPTHTISATEVATETAPPTERPTIAAATTRVASPRAVEGSPRAATPRPKPTKTATPVPSPTATPGEIPKWDGTTRLTMLLMGVDRREDEPSRSDSMILVNIDPIAKTARMLSIPRDLRVIIPGYGIHKINAAYAFGDLDKLRGGGPGLVVRTIETNFGVHIDYFAEVDFAGFVKIVDSVGGVTLDVPYPIKDDEYPASGNNYMRIYFPAGWQHLDGERALQYARTRHDDGDGMRSVRQQQLLLALREQAVSFDLLAKAGELLGEVSDAVRTDLSPLQALQLARLASEFSPAGIETVALDAALSEDDGPDGYYLDADWEIAGQILSDFAGTDVIPPMSALQNPNRDLPIQIQDATGIDGLAERAAELLRADGFKDVEVTDHSGDEVPASYLTANQDDLSTAFLIAGMVGLDLDVVRLRNQSAPFHGPGRTGSPRAETSPTVTPTADPTRDRIVLVLGADARDPSDFNVDPFQDESFPVGKRKTPASNDSGD